MITREQFIADIRECCEQHGISTTEFGLRCFKDGAFFGRLSNGMSPTLERIEKAYSFISSGVAQSAQSGEQQTGTINDLCD